ncbi:beta-glucosidase D [Penicillium brevicompactum]|uniref:beta-glucosidase D n=1 Tax=Penicillium brevicompactum TaxID=5074 RepID=UPI0025404CBA|nr:beta-glucosidase D [Penicillium brevicompactum]KAJ5347565.1 beta-glucosidase D [Penicillium brevicompactum]
MKIHSLSLLCALSGAAVAASDSKAGLLSNGNVALGDWQAAYEKATKFVSKLNTTEKLKLITGSDATTTDGQSFTALKFLDGSMGLQDYYYVSAFSQSSALAMTWDKDAMYKQARAVAVEAYLKGVQVINGPTSQPMGRTPWGGRLVETFGPDPYLNGIATGLGVEAYNDVGIIAGAKRPTEPQVVVVAAAVVWEVEVEAPPGSSNSSSNTAAPPSSTGSSLKARAMGGSSSSSAPYSSNADSKTLHETYLWSFYDAVHSGLGGMMCAMTKVNNTLACESSAVLLDILKEELGYPGLVFPDQMAQQNALASAISGLDYGSSSLWSTSAMTGFLKGKNFTEARLNDMATRNLIGWYHANLDNGTQPATESEDAYVDVRGDHAKLIRSYGSKSMVLLKNKNNTLPLNKPHKMAIFGSHARAAIAGPNMAFSVEGSGPTYDGHLATDSGSGQGSLPYLITPETALTIKASQDGTMLRWVANDTYSSSSGSTLVMQGSDSTSVTPSISAYAENMNVCLVFINALAGEGADRTELYNTDQDALVNEVAENCANTVVVINSAGVRLVDNWIENENVTAVLYGSLLGQESGNSIVDVLYGDVNPSGRLIHTIAKNESDYNVGLCYTQQCNFTEGNFIDYRYFDAYNVTPRYEFGYGLSYTQFKYSDLSINGPKALSTFPTGKRAVGGYEDLWDIVASVSVKVQNAGSVDGAEVPQLYISYPKAAQQPLRQLRGFENVEIKKGKQKEVKFNLRRRDISYWDVKAQNWAVAPGSYRVYVGASSRDLKKQGSFVVHSK